MNMNDYQDAAMRTANFDAYSRDEDVLLNGALGLCGEAGEFADILKKHCYQNSKENPVPLDTEHLMKELGDVLWYVALLATGMGVKIADIMQMNIDKLLKRYPDGFEANRSQHRAEGDV